MRHNPLEAKFESVPRESPVKAAGVPDRASASARIGQGLQRLYQPAGEGQPDRIAQLLQLLQGQLEEHGQQRPFRRRRGRKDRAARR
jgi:hypothetical protein